MKKSYLLFISALLCLFICFVLVSCDSSESQKSIEEKAEVYVYFDRDDGSPANKMILHKGDKVEKPENPVREGYIFHSWTVNNEQWAFDSHTLTDDTTFVARWIPIEYKIKYIGMYTNNPTTYTIEDNIVLKDGIESEYDFLGWYTDSDFKVGVTEIPRGTQGDLIFYAKKEYQPFSFELNEQGFYTVTGLEDSSLTEIVIPSYYNGKRVTEIGELAFNRMEDIVSVEIPDTITKIGKKAFSSCSALKTLKFGSALDIIGEYAFYFCSSLEEVVIPDCVEEIDDHAFYYCYNLKKISFGKNINKIGDYAFNECKKLKEVLIPNNVLSIGKSVFGNCYMLENVTLEDGLSVIGEGMFIGCSSLHEIKLPYSIKKIGNYAFARTSISEIILPNNLVEIGEGEFKYSELSSIELPSGITRIENETFMGCGALEEISLKNIKYIGNRAFYECGKISSVIIEDTVDEIWDEAFAKTNIENVYIPKTVNYLGKNVFEQKSKTEKIDIFCETSSFPWFWSENFNDNLNNVYWGTLSFGKTEDGIKWIETNDNKGITVLTCDDSATDIVIPDMINGVKVTKISESAFAYRWNLKSVSIGNNITKIYKSTFKSCSSLESVQLGSSIYSIGDNAFYGCISLKSITLPDGVIEIGEKAFENCYSLKEVALGSGLHFISSYAFGSCNSLESIIIPKSVVKMGSGVFDSCTSLVIYCAAEEQPIDWADDWNEIDCLEPTTPDVIWGYKE